jgi:DNA-binding PadR family transcriptional regulator
MAISVMINMESQHAFTRRSIGIPKGFLSYGVLSILGHTPMSGSELMEEIEKRTGWRPSPGSIYPYLAKLKEGNFIEEAESEAGLKRFALTEKGKGLLKEYERERGVFGRKFHSIRRMWLKIYREMDEDLYDTSLRLFEAVEGISPYLKGEEAKEAAEKVRSILVKAAEEIEEQKKRLNTEKGMR